MLAAATVVRIVGLQFSVVDLSVDEAQYWVWSKTLQFGYMSKPPLIAWIISLASSVCGNTEPCIRSPSPILYFICSLAVYGIARALYDARVALLSALSFGLAVGVAFSARIISTDVPLLCCWAVALFAYVRLLSDRRWRWALLLGVALGLGLLAKYAMFYFALGALLAAALDRNAARLLASPQAWAAGIIALLMIAPNVVWNFTHGFSTIHQTRENILGDGFDFSPLRGLAFLGAQFGIIGPIVFGAMLVAMARIGSPLIPRADRILVAFALPPLALVTAVALFSHANANWAATAYVSGFVVAVALLCRAQAWKLLAASLLFGGIAQAALLAADPMAMRLHIAFLDNEDGNGDPYHVSLGWRGYAEQAGALARRVGAKSIVGVGRTDVAALRYYWRDQPEQILAWPVTGDEFELAPRLTYAARQPLLYVSSVRSTDELKNCFKAVERFADIITATGPTTSRRTAAVEVSNFIPDNPLQRYCPPLH